MFLLPARSCYIPQSAVERTAQPPADRNAACFEQKLTGTSEPSNNCNCFLGRPTLSPKEDWPERPLRFLPCCLFREKKIQIVPVISPLASRAACLYEVCFSFQQLMRKIQGQCLLPCREWGGNQGLVSATARHSFSATALPVGSGSQNQAVPTEAHLAQSPPQHSFREQRNQTETTNQRKRTLTLHLDIRKTHEAFLSGEPHSQTSLFSSLLKAE